MTDHAEYTEQEGMEDEVMNGLSAEQLAEAITAQGANTTPLSAQETVKLEANEWDSIGQG